MCIKTFTLPLKIKLEALHSHDKNGSANVHTFMKKALMSAFRKKPVKNFGNKAKVAT